MCFHHGANDNVLSFSEAWVDATHNSLEDWLSSCLEPRLAGIRVNKVENTFLIDVPESISKPHRDALSKNYFYRHNTSSIPMPEIMISSMYTSQDYLNFEVEAFVSRDNRRMNVILNIKNLSRISGSRPKVQIQIFGANSPVLHFHNPPYFNDAVVDHYGWDDLLTTLGIARTARCETGSLFAEKTLYPSDQIVVRNSTTRNNLVAGVNYLLLRTDCMFKEGQRRTDYFVFELRGGDASMPIVSTATASAEAVIRRFVELRDADAQAAPVRFVDPV